MPRLPARPEPVDPRLSRLLWQAMALALLALLVLAMFRGAVPGALAFWLLAAPATALLTLHRHVLATAWRARLVRATPRRRPLQMNQVHLRSHAQGRNAVPRYRLSRARRGAFAPAAAGTPT
ncbi:hypothetical protein [Arenimonas sp.]|uniref:hypothetical protein n=1 Tax=Arenimonas sp. TaxID=1872635 RepID=UPI002E3089DB|nr:hypothetical protein [Arenimonas sp.]HEX4854067.1 hypothetical protein [Arenimonas sp.]